MNEKVTTFASAIIALLSAGLVTAAETESRNVISVYSYSLNDSTEVLVASGHSSRGPELKTINICGKDNFSKLKLGSFIISEHDKAGNLYLALSVPAWTGSDGVYGGLNFDIKKDKMKTLSIKPVFDPMSASVDSSNHITIPQGDKVKELLIVPKRQHDDLNIALGDLEQTADSKWSIAENEVLIDCRKLFDEYEFMRQNKVH